MVKSKTLTCNSIAVDRTYNILKLILKILFIIISIFSTMCVILLLWINDYANLANKLDSMLQVIAIVGLIVFILRFVNKTMQNKNGK